MENQDFLEILYNVTTCLSKKDWFVAQEYIKIEIENLKGITEKKCKSSRYYCDDWYCKECRNLNCNDNLRKLKI